MKPAPNTGAALACIALAALLSPAADCWGAVPERQRLLQDLDELRLRKQVAALGLVIVKDDRVSLLATLGLADRAAQKPIRDDAVFRIGSISKMFTGLLAAELETLGVLDLGAPISRWKMRGTYSNPWQGTHPVTTAQLLEHSAGLTDLAQPEWDYSDPRQLPLRETLRLYPQERVTRWPPGLHSSYSNAGAGLAGHVLELASGKSYEQLMREVVFEPLGMGDSSVLPPAADRLPTGYDVDGSTPIPYWHQIFRPFAAINSSLGDMSRFLRLFINRGTLEGQRLFSIRVIERVETPATTLAARRGLDYGYGLGSYTWLRNGILFHGHGGDADGYLSRMAYTRSNNSGYFLVITAFQGATLGEMRRRVETYLTADLQAQAPPAVAGLTDSARRSLPGRYQRVTHRFPAASRGSGQPELRIVERDGELFSRRDGGPARPMLPVAENLFRRPWQNRATFFAGPGEDGIIYLQEDSDNYARIED